MHKDEEPIEKGEGERSDRTARFKKQVIFNLKKSQCHWAVIAFQFYISGLDSVSNTSEFRLWVSKACLNHSHFLIAPLFCWKLGLQRLIT